MLSLITDGLYHITPIYAYSSTLTLKLKSVVRLVLLNIYISMYTRDTIEPLSSFSLVKC